MNSLPILDLSMKDSLETISELRQALLKYGAFRLRAPKLKQAVAGGLLHHARDFFQLPDETKESTKGYSGFGTELIRGTTPIPKEGINFSENSNQQEGRNDPPVEFSSSVRALHDVWELLRDQLFSTVLNGVLESERPLTGTDALDYESVSIQYYNSQRMIVPSRDYSPPHKDGGTLAILIREDDRDDGLEVADLESTEERSSDGVGREASFLRVPTAPDEVVVLAGTLLERLLGRTKARACVHRVVGPGQKPRTEDRVSVGIFRACAPPA